MFVAPNLAAVAVFMLFPLGFSLYMSFQNWDLFSPAKFVGLANYRSLFTGDPLFSHRVAQLGGVHRRDRRPHGPRSASPWPVCSTGKSRESAIFRTIIFLPLAVSSVVMAVVWQFVFNTNNGLLNIMLGWIGIGPIPWLVDPKWAMTVTVHRQRMAQRSLRDRHPVGRHARRAGQPL